MCSPFIHNVQQHETRIKEYCVVTRILSRLHKLTLLVDSLQNQQTIIKHSNMPHSSQKHDCGMFYHTGMDSQSFEMYHDHSTSLQQLSQLSDKQFSKNFRS